MPKIIESSRYFKDAYKDINKCMQAITVLLLSLVFVMETMLSWCTVFKCLTHFLL